MTNSQRQALHLAKKFGWKVFPVNPNNKRPLIAGWQARASSEPEDLEILFQLFPHAMIGVLTGPPNMLTVFDIDMKNGVDGLQSLQDLGIRMSTRVISRTPTGGAHFYHFSGLRKFKSTAGKIGPGIDVRCKGGYVVAPGSIGSAGEYRWLDNIEPERNQLGALTPALFELLEKTDEAKVQGSRRGGISSSILEPVSEGRRNETMASRCGYLFSKGYKPDDVLVMMERINRDCFHPPIDDRELFSIHNSIRKREGV